MDQRGIKAYVSAAEQSSPKLQGVAHSDPGASPQKAQLLPRQMTGRPQHTFARVGFFLPEKFFPFSSVHPSDPRWSHSEPVMLPERVEPSLSQPSGRLQNIP